MSQLKVAVVGFDITPKIHPQYGAFGTTPVLSEIDQPLLARCIVLEHDDRRLFWFGSDLCGDNVSGTDALRDEVAEELGLRRDQILWSTSQTHSSVTLPGSSLPGGSSITKRGNFDQTFCDAERKRFIGSYTDAAREAMERLEPATV